MKTTQPNRTLQFALAASLLLALSEMGSYGQFTFNSGSNGSYGPMNITADTTLDLPPDGIFHCTTINVAKNTSLRFRPNVLNTPVYLLATEDVSIEGLIDVSGTGGNAVRGGFGGPGGFAGGNPGTPELSPGDGNGPGGGKASPDGGAGAYGTKRGAANVYGSPLLIPMVGGSGGGGMPGFGGSGGGGAILLASNTRITVAGGVSSMGGFGGAYNKATIGSGGAIRLVAPVVAGAGSLDIRGGQISGFSSYGGHGRIRIDCLDRRSISLLFEADGERGMVSIGANMVVFPPNPPRLDITQVAGSNIAVGTSVPVFFMLPQNASKSQTVTVQASNFGGKVPIRVVLTPDHGPSASFDAEIDNTTVNPASVAIPVTVPVTNEQVQVHAWTR